MSDKALQQAVLNELEWDPRVNPAQIGVIVKDGAVTLTGHVSSYSEKWAAVEAAERVPGVLAVADEIKVKLPTTSVRDDAEIAEAIARTFRWNALVPDTVRAEVRNGFVTLKGEVEWDYQREEAARSVRNITGVTGLSNLIKVKPKTGVKPEELERRIADAIQRIASLDASQIWVTIEDGGKVHLHGHVRSLWEKRAAEEAARSAPGVSEVINEIVVVP
jgi:osmotically-inducible protein OsmY